MTSSPIVARWELSRRLANRRKELGMDVSTVTKALGFSRNYWSAVENDRTLIAVEKMQLLFELMDIEEAERAELLELRSIGRKRGWWDDYSDVLDDETKRFIGLEDGATRIRTYESNIIPGLLQIADYSRAVIESDPDRTADEIDDFLSVREIRQRRIRADGRLAFIAVLSEACLLQQVGGPKVQKAQLTHLLDLATESHDALEIHILPFGVNPGIIASSSTLLIFEFGSPHLPEVAWQEAIRSLDEVESDDEGFSRLERSWNESLARCSNRQDSIATIESHLNSLN